MAIARFLVFWEKISIKMVGKKAGQKLKIKYWIMEKRRIILRIRLGWNNDRKYPLKIS